MTTPPTSSNSLEAKLFRDHRMQAVRIPAEFELPGDRVLIRRAGVKLIIEPLRERRNIAKLLAHWRADEALGPEDQFPDLADNRICPQRIY